MSGKALPRASRRIAGFLSVLVLAVGCATEQGAMQDAGEGDGMAADTRTVILLPAADRARLLTEMRTMLGAVSQIVSGAASGDTALMHAAAISAGMRAALDVSPTMRSMLPGEFLAIGAGTHDLFDSLGALVSRGGRQQDAFGLLAGIMSRCVSCHSEYQLEVRP